MEVLLILLKVMQNLGKGDWAILEADESDGSFLKFQ